FPESFLRPLVPVVTALQIRLISFGINRMTLGYATAFLICHPQMQFFRDLAGDLLLHRHDIGKLSVESLAPNLRAAGYVHEIYLDHQRISQLRHSTGDNGINAQVAPNFSRVHILPVETKYGATRHHTQGGNLRQVIDQTFRNPLAQVFGVGVRRAIYEWQDSE